MAKEYSLTENQVLQNEISEFHFSKGYFWSRPTFCAKGEGAPEFGTKGVYLSLTSNEHQYSSLR